MKDSAVYIFHTGLNGHELVLAGYYTKWLFRST